MTRNPIIRAWSDAIIADNFAGGGGASSGIEAALGRSPDIAVNHDPEAIAMHAANHPATKHFVENVWQIDPAKACDGRPVALAWFSPTCSHFSNAKGTPLDEESIRIRALAWVAVRWAAAVKPRIVMLENVVEFEKWGPLHREHTHGCSDRRRECLDRCRLNQPIRSRAGQTFRAFVERLRSFYVNVEWRQLVAADYGAPTMRKRLFLIASDEPIRWPAPTHGPGRIPHRTTAECIDWSLEVPSIFDRAKPYSEATERRIVVGLDRYVLSAERPFIAPITPRVVDRSGRVAELAAAYLVHLSNGERPGQTPRTYDIEKPLSTVVAQGQKHGLVVAYLAKAYGERAGGFAGGAPLDRPIGTVTAKDHHYLVSAFLLKYYGTSTAQGVAEPLSTITGQGVKHALVTVVIDGETYVVVDIGMRRLVPPELFLCQGFPRDYVIAPIWNGKPLTQTAQIRMVGNSVSPPLAAAMVRAQLEAA